MPEKYYEPTELTPLKSSLREEEVPLQSSTGTRTVPLLCFGLYHSKVQGRQFEKKVIERVSRTDEIVIITEVDPAELECKDKRQTRGLLSLVDAFKALHEHYDRISIFPIERNLQSNLLRAIYKHSENFAMKKVKEERDKGAYRKAASYFLACMYIKAEATFIRSKIMLSAAEQQARDNPNATLVLVAGEKHIEEILGMTATENALNAAKTVVQPVKLNDDVRRYLFDLFSADPGGRYADSVREDIRKTVEGMMGSDKPFGETSFQSLFNSSSESVVFEEAGLGAPPGISVTVLDRIRMRDAELSKKIQKILLSQVDAGFLLSQAAVTPGLPARDDEKLAEEVVMAVADRIDKSSLETPILEKLWKLQYWER